MITEFRWVAIISKCLAGTLLFLSVMWLVSVPIANRFDPKLIALVAPFFCVDVLAVSLIAFRPGKKWVWLLAVFAAFLPLIALVVLASASRPIVDRVL